MTGLIIKMRLASVLPPVLRIEVDSDWNETLRFSMGRIFEFITKEKVELLSFDDNNEYNPYPDIEQNHIMGMCIYALFTTQNEALDFINKFKNGQ